MSGEPTAAQRDELLARHTATAKLTMLEWRQLLHAARYSAALFDKLIDALAEGELEKTSGEDVDAGYVFSHLLYEPARKGRPILDGP